MKIEDIAQELGISINEIRKRLEVGGYNNSGDVITNEEYKYLKVNSKNQAQNIKENVSEFFIEKKYTQDNFTFETISVNDDFWSQELVFHSTEKSKKESSEDIPENKITQQEDLNKLNTENPSGNITAATIKQGINKTEKIEQAENENRIKVEIKKNITEVKKECVSNNKIGGRAQHNSIASNTYKAKASTTDKNFSKDGSPLKEGSGILNTKNKLKADRTSNKESYDDDDKKDNGGDKKTPFVGYFHKINTENIKKFKLLKKEKLKNKNANKTIEDTKKIVVTNKVSLKDLAVMLNCEVEDLASLCHDLDIPITTQYQTLERNVILLLAGEYNYEVSFPEVDKKNDDDIQQNSRSRKPIITVVGHVDHGKTTLVDYICKSSVAKLEQGGITQNINAYNITTEGGDEFTLIDTPGHKIFTEMRARAINIADIAIVIIAADSGIQEQTKEILQQITFFGKPTVFAFNKIDKEGANVNKIKELLATLNFVTEDWGGQYQCQEISALKGTGIEKLLEKVMLEATILNLKVDYNCPANGIVLDSFFDKTIGYQNKILVKEGTLKEHDFIVAGILYGKIRQIKKGNAITKEVFPSESAIITGISGCAQPGESFSIVKNEREGRERADKYQQILREQHAKAQQKITFDMLKKRMHEGDKKKVGIIVNACSRDIGRVILEVLSNFSSDKYSIDILKENIGEILNSDIDAAINSKAMIIGFNVKISPATMKYAEKNNTIVKIYNVIYDLSEHIDELLESYDGKNKELKNVGKAEVLQIFKIKKAGTIAGCVIREGAAHIKDIVNVNRNGKIVFTGNIKSMRHGPVDISEAKLDTECGVCINRYDDVKKGDILEFMQRQ